MIVYFIYTYIYIILCIVRLNCYRLFLIYYVYLYMIISYIVSRVFTRETCLYFSIFSSNAAVTDTHNFRNINIVSPKFLSITWFKFCASSGMDF
jgi:hypothetical protein